jgi:hypothetical protein
MIVFTYPNYGQPDGYSELTAHSGQSCTIVRELGDDERDPEVGRMFIVRFEDGVEGTANEDELHDHKFGPFERTWMSGNLVRRCAGCSIVSMDSDEEEEEA